jgi:hypothetical protein
MSRSRDLANLAGDATGLETLTVSDITDLTSSAAELNKLDGVTASTAELNKLAGVTATTAELNYVDGVGSALQTQINAKLGASDTFNGTIGSTANFPSGSIIQYKNVVVTGLSAQAHQSTSEAATSITASITPKRTGSKIHVICTFISGLIVNSGAGLDAHHYLKRTGSSVTDTTLGVMGGSDTQYNIYFEAAPRTSNAQNVFPFVLSIPDTPGHSNTTDAITYTVFVKGGSSGTLAVQVNKSGSRDANFTFLETVG